MKKIILFLLLFIMATSSVSAENKSYNRVVITKHGPANVLKLVKEQILPEPGKDEVRIKVLAATASFTDVMVRKGHYPGINAKLPYPPGYDLVGVIDKVGNGVTDFKIGDFVADLTVYGAYTQYAIRPVKYLVKVPKKVDVAQAVSVVLAYMTAYQMLHRVADVKPGQTILIHGVSGSVGSALAQLGKLERLKMFGTASKRKHDYVKSLGVTPIDYHSEDFVKVIMAATNNRGVDAVFDAVGYENFKRSYKVVAPGGDLVTYGFYKATLKGKAQEKFKVMKDFVKMTAWSKWRNFKDDEGRTVTWYGITDMQEKHPQWFRDDLKLLFDLLLAGKIKPNIYKKMPLSEAAKAHEMIEASEVRGKIVLMVNHE